MINKKILDWIKGKNEFNIFDGGNRWVAHNLRRRKNVSDFGIPTAVTDFLIAQFFEKTTFSNYRFG